MVGQSHKCWQYQRCRSFHAIRGRNRDNYGDLNSGHNQVRVEYGNGECGTHDNQRLRDLLSLLHPDQSDFDLHSDCDRDRKSKPGRYMVRQPVQYGNDKQQRRLYAQQRWYGNHHGHLDAGLDQVRPDIGDSNRSFDDHVGNRDLYPNIHPIESDVYLRGYRDGYRKSKPSRYMVRQPNEYGYG